MRAMLIFSKNKKTADAPAPAWIKSIEERKTLRILRVKGRIDVAALGESSSQRALQARQQKGFEYKHLLLDFADVTYIDSSAVAALLLTLRDYQKAHHKLGVINLGEEPRNMLQIAKVDRLFLSYETEAQALKDLES